MSDTPNHADRGHSQWSASATTRNVTCAGAIALSTLAPEEKESEHAARGTACHEAAEQCLRSGCDANSLLGSTIQTKQHEIEIDEEIVEGAQEYVDYVRGQIGQSDAGFWIEEHFSLAALNPPMEAGGTCDAIVYAPAGKSLEVIDLKFGRGAVDAEGNPQLRTYAVGALLAFSDLDVETTTVTIVQPRAPIKGETIRSESFHAAELIDWTDDLLKAMRRSKQALDEFEAINGSRTLFDEWAEKWLNPGKCKFCPAEGYCPALRKRALSVAPTNAREWFEDPTLQTPPVLPNAPELLSPAERGHILDGLEMLDDWIRAVRGAEHTLAERGDAATGYMLVDKIGNRIFTETDEAKLAATLKEKLKLTDEQLFKKKILSPAQAEKIVGSKRKAEVDALCTKPLKGTNLVAVGKTTRPRAKSKVENFLEEVKD